MLEYSGFPIETKLQSDSFYFLDRTNNVGFNLIPLFLSFELPHEIDVHLLSRINSPATDSFVYMISSDMIGQDKIKTNQFGREGLGLLFFFWLVLFWRPYCNAGKQNHKINNKFLERHHLFVLFLITNHIHV